MFENKLLVFSNVASITYLFLCCLRVGFNLVLEGWISKQVTIKSLLQQHVLKTSQYNIRYI